MKKYKIECIGYGGRCSITQKSKEFIEEWKKRFENGETPEDLASELEDDIDFLDDNFDYIYGGYADTHFDIYEINNEVETLVNEKIELPSFMCRPAYANEESSEEPNEIPVITYHSAEKGTFGTWYIECEDTLNIDDIALSTVETCIGEFIQNLYYKGEVLEINDENSDAYPKHENAHIGWIDPEYHQTQEVFECPTNIKKNWEEYIKE